MKWPAQRIDIQATFSADGFVVLRSLFTADQLREVEAHLERYLAEIVPHVPPMDVFYEDVQTKSDVRMLSRMERHDDYFRHLLTQGQLPELAAALLDCAITPHDAAYFNKPARVGEATPPHQDGFYFHLTPCEAITLWLAIDPVNVENGCLHYVAGSHRQGLRPHGRTQVLGFSQGIADYGSAVDMQHEVAACVCPGDVIAHDAMTIHRAGPNQSPRSRRALGFVYFSSRARVDSAAREQYQQQLARDLSLEGKIECRISRDN